MAAISSVVRKPFGTVASADSDFKAAWKKASSADFANDSALNFCDFMRWWIEYDLMNEWQSAVFYVAPIEDHDCRARD